MAPGNKYTDNPNEVPTQTTTPTPRQVIDMVRQGWPALTENGGRTLTAQFMIETAGGKFCFNWNLGNVKAAVSDPHMYLRNVWEVDSPENGQLMVAKGGGLARMATAADIQQHGWSCPNGKCVVVFEPPHGQCRFHAYASLQDGAQRWVSRHQQTAQKFSNFVMQLNSGDCAGAAHTLKLVGYYTAGEADYAHGMTTQKAVIDKTLGPASA